MAEAFDPDKYLAEKTGKQTPAAAFDPDKYLAEKTGSQLVEEPSDFDNLGKSLAEGKPLESLKNAAVIGGKGLISGLQTVGEGIEKYSAAPTRAALSALADKKNPLTAFSEQFGEDPEKAATGQKIAEQLGVPSKDVALNQKQIMGYDPNEGLPENVKGKGTVNPQEIAGAGINVAADVSNLIPAEKVVSFAAGKAGGLSKGLKKTSEELAFKQSGAMLKDARRALGKNQMETLGRTMLDKTVDVADEAGNITKVPLMKAGDTVEDIAEKTGLLKKQTGEKIGQIYDSIDSKIADENFLKSLPKDKAEKLASASRFDPKVDVPELHKMINEKYGSKLEGKKVLSKVEDLLQDMTSRGNTLNDSLALKGELDEMINYSKQTQDLPAYQKALVDIRNHIRDKTNKYATDVADVLGTKTGKELNDLNKTYGAVSTLNQISSDRTARNVANRMISPSDYGAGAIGTLATHNPVYGVASAIGNKLGRERGAGIGARGAESLYNLTQGLLPVTEPMTEMATKGAGMLNDKYVKGLLRNQKEQEK